MTQDGTFTIVKMGFLTVTGWTMTAQFAMEIAKILSILVPTLLSVAVFIRDTKRQKKHEQDLAQKKHKDDTDNSSN